MRIVGISIVNDAVRLDLPVEPAVISILPLCHEVIVNVGPDDTGAAERLCALDPTRVRVIRGRWDRARGRGALADETNRVLAEADADWVVYIQADEVLLEHDGPVLRAAMEHALDDDRLEGLLVDYLHFYGNFDTVATNRSWYRREVRVIRPNRGIQSHGDAQGFRVGPDARPLRARRTGARIFHYGWARPPDALQHKRAVDHLIDPRRRTDAPDWPP